MKKEARPPRIFWSIRMRAACGGKHISGAEGIFGEKDVEKALFAYAKRAFSHSKGQPDSVILKAERLCSPPLSITALPISTVETKNQKEARQKAVEFLMTAGVSRRAATSALKIIGEGGLKGAAILEAKEGTRLDHESDKGIRASMLGITKRAEGELLASLEEMGINEDHKKKRVRDALVIASKVAACPQVLAEICISDDPDYTTGYVAGAAIGYVRLPGIKKNGGGEGGRVFFVQGNYQKGKKSKLTEYLQKTPVIVGKISPLNDIITFHEGKTEKSKRAKARLDLKPGSKKIIGKNN
ncbi:MAG: 6-carboxyhexanoate--CoA ligase [Nitrospiraceae bacterium]|nr:6-carboxyhexanoate--CoA ligase [Nitrospiraceae bacterium]